MKKAFWDRERTDRSAYDGFDLDEALALEPSHEPRSAKTTRSRTRKPSVPIAAVNGDSAGHAIEPLPLHPDSSL